MAKNHITLIVPFLNEEEALPIFIETVDRVLTSLKKKHKGTKFSVLFVNDGSTDLGELIVSKARMKAAQVQLVNLSRNFGKEQALYAGFMHAKGDAVIPMDVDLQDPPEVIEEMITKWRAGADIVDAKRARRDEDTAVKRVTARWFYKIFNIFAERPIAENVGDFRLFDRTVVEAVKRVGDRKRFNKEIFSWIGFKTDQVEFDRPERSTGQPSQSFWKLWNLALDGIFAGSTLPLRMWGYLGFLIALMAFLYMVFVVLFTLVFGRDVPGYSSTITIILFFGGLNLLSVGILGEYIGRIYTEVRDRPTYLVRSTMGLDDDA